jgi:hypothetical protein
MTDLFVYYQVRGELAAGLRPQVAALQSSLVRRFGIRASLKRRPEEKDGLQTWMEVYAGVPENFLPALQQAAVEARLPIEGERHHEIFEDLPECA